MNTYTGQKVVCVDAGLRKATRRWNGDAPVEGKVYTVIGRLDGRVLGEAEDGLLLREIRNNVYSGSYAVSRFRPACDRKTDISVFKKELVGESA